MLPKIVITGGLVIQKGGIADISDVIIMDSMAFQNNVMFDEPLPYQFTCETLNGIFLIASIFIFT